MIADWMRSQSFDHHPPCPGGCNELADECRCARPNPFGSMRIEQPGDREALMRQPKASRGCCTACAGAGGLREPCSDCFQTGHAHPSDQRCEESGNG